MAAIHVLERVDGPEFKVVVHWATPAGNNSVGVSWKSALINSGRGGATILRDGDGTAGTISAAEKTQVLAGDVVETQGTIRIDSVVGNAAAVNAYVDAQAARIVAEAQASLAALLKYFGATRG